MARQIISEYKAKTIVLPLLGQNYAGISFNRQDKVYKLNSLSDKRNYVVKVDQGIKGRFKKGLVIINLSSTKVAAAVSNLKRLGYDQFLIEPYWPHNKDEEQYLSLERAEGGIK